MLDVNRVTEEKHEYGINILGSKYYANRILELRRLLRQQLNVHDRLISQPHQSHLEPLQREIPQIINFSFLLPYQSTVSVRHQNPAPTDPHVSDPLPMALSLHWFHLFRYFTAKKKSLTRTYSHTATMQ